MDNHTPFNVISAFRLMNPIGSSVCSHSTLVLIRELLKELTCSRSPDHWMLGEEGVNKGGHPAAGDVGPVIGDKEVEGVAGHKGAISLFKMKEFGCHSVKRLEDLLAAAAECIENIGIVFC